MKAFTSMADHRYGTNIGLAKLNLGLLANMIGHNLKVTAEDRWRNQCLRLRAGPLLVLLTSPCRLSVAYLSLACRLPVAYLSLICRLSVAYPVAYPVGCRCRIHDGYMTGGWHQTRTTAVSRISVFSRKHPNKPAQKGRPKGGPNGSP